MTLQAGSRGVFAGQSKTGAGMVEGRAGPVRGAVTHRTVLRVSERRMVWIGSTGVIGDVAGIARAAGQAEVVIDVAQGAGECGVRAG